MSLVDLTKIEIENKLDKDTTLYVENEGKFRRAKISEITAKLRTIMNLDALYQTAAGMQDMYPELVKKVEPSDTGIKITYWDESSTEIEVAASGGQSFNSGYVDGDGFLHLTQDGEDISKFDPFFVGSGGGGGGGAGSKIVFAMYTSPSFSVLESSVSALIRGKFSSIDTETDIPTGAGNLAISVGGTVRENRTVEQGDFEVDIRKYLMTGSNAVKLTMTDSYGTTASRNFTVTLESFVLEWSLAPTVKNTESTLSFYITPTGAGMKTIYVYLDGELYSTDTVSSSGRRLTKILTDLPHGAHTIEAYGQLTVGGATLESNHLSAAVAQIAAGNNTPVIAVNWPTDAVSQYTTVSIEHTVIDPRNNPTEVSYLVNGEVYATETIDQSAHVWNYRPMTAGNFTLGIRCGSKTEEKVVTVSGIGSDIQEVTDGLDVKVEPSSMKSLKDWSYGAYNFTLSDGFDEVNGGLKTDSDGVHCIKIIRGDRLTLNYNAFADDARRTGKALKLIYTVQNSTALNAEAIRCISGGIGFRIRANDVECIAEQTSIQMDTCEEEKTELDINIQPSSESRLMSIWESCSSFVYAQYATGENFTQATPEGIVFGSDECDVLLYLFRGYSRDLTNDELKANFYADGKDGAEILARYNRNQIYDSTGHIDVTAVASLNPNLHVMTWHAERFSLGKKDNVNGYLSHVHVAGGPEHNFTAYLAVQKVQGTSSVEHAATAGGNQDFDMQDGITLEDGTKKAGYSMSDTAIPVNYLTYKKNIASQDHIINSSMSEWYHRYQPSLRQARKDNPGVRDCMESQMAVLFFHNTGSSAVQIGPDLVQPDETIFYGLGNICNSKKNNEAFQYEPIVIEVLNNTEPQVRFKSDDLSNFGDNFEFRYLDETMYTEEQAIALFQEFVSFVHSCDYTEAAGMALPETVVYNGQAFTTDSTEYRKAKWRAEAWNYVDKESILYHQNFTLHFLGRDSRGKNMFWAYDPATKKWDLRFTWDLDTFICVNNEGLRDIQPGHLDTDTDGTKDIFNAADNVIFANNRAVFMTDLRENYLACESAGAWDTSALLAFIEERQSQVCESLWIEDVEHNDLRTLTNLGINSYLAKATGKKRLLIKKALVLQGAFIASYYLSTAATSDSASMRGYTPTEWVGVEPNGILKITPYCNLFVNTHAGSIDRAIRAEAGETVEIDLTSALNDTEIYIRSAEWIQGLGSLAALYIGDCNLSKMKRLTRAEIGSDVAGYVNTNFTTASFDNCVSLEYVNLSGLPNTKQAYDFSPNLMLKEIHTKGSGVTGLTFAKNGRLKVALLNAVSSLSLSGLRQIETLELAGYDALTSLTVERCPSVNSYALAKAAVNLARVRLLEIVWNVGVEAYSVLMRLHGIVGIDDDGGNVANGVLTGNVFFTSVSQTKFNAIKAVIPTVGFTFGELLEEHTVTFQNDDGAILNTQIVEHGGSAEDPIKAGYIKTPTKASDDDNDYEFYKWDRSLDYITGDTVITATYTQSVRINTVTYKDRDGTALEVHKVPAHGSCKYEGEDLKLAGYVWIGWDKEAVNVVADMEITAVYIYPDLPSTIKDMSQYDYAYSDDPADNAAYTFSEFYAIVKTGQTLRYIPPTTQIKMVLHTDVIKDVYIIFNLHSVGHYELADGSGRMSNADWYMTGLLNEPKRMNPTATNVGGWDASERRAWMNNELYPALDPRWRAFISKSKTLSNAGDQSLDIVTSEDYLRLPSTCEMGFELNSVPYKNEVSERAGEVAFSQYTDSNSKIKKTFNGEGSAQYYFLRSALASSSASFCAVGNVGNFSSNYAISAWYLCVGFSS